MAGFRIDTGIRSNLKNGQPQRRPAARRARLEDPAHLQLVRQLPCIISGRSPAGEAAHIRYANAHYGKPITGFGTKPDDCWALPLSRWFHTESSGAQHRHGEEGWWIERGIDPLIVSDRLYAASVALRRKRTVEGEIVEVLSEIVLEAYRNSRSGAVV